LPVPTYEADRTAREDAIADWQTSREFWQANRDRWDEGKLGLKWGTFAALREQGYSRATVDVGDWRDLPSNFARASQIAL
jgi:hypothetical protein